MKQLTKRELTDTYGGNPALWAVIVENAEKVANAAIDLYNNVKDSVRDWGHTAGCKESYPCK